MKSDLVVHSAPQAVTAAPAGSWQGIAGVGAGAQAEDDSIDLRQLLSILRRRIWLVLAVTVVALAGTAFFVLRQPPVYRATAVIRIHDERQAVAGGIGGAAVDQALGRSADPIQSHLQVLKSRTVAAKVVDQLGLRLRPVNGGTRGVELRNVVVPENTPVDTITFEFHDTEYHVRSNNNGVSVEAPYGVDVQIGGISLTVASRPPVAEARYVVRPRGAVIDLVIGSLGTIPRERTNVVDVEFTAIDPVLAQRVVNALVEEFQATSAREAQQQAARRRAFVEAQLAQTDSMLAEALAALTAFQSREEVFSLEQKFLAQQSGQFSLDIRREELAADLDMLRSLLARLSDSTANNGELNTLISTPSVAGNPLVSQLYSQLIGYETERSSLTTGSWGLSGAHPDVQRLGKLIEETRARLIDAVSSHVEALEARLAALDQLRERNALALKSLPETGAEEARLRQQVVTINKMADQLREEYQRARIAEAVEAGQVVIVDRAMSPGYEISSRRGIKLSLGLLVGLMLGAGLAFVLEQMNTTIRGQDDLEAHLGLSALAVVPRLDLTAAAAGAPSALLPRLRKLLGRGGEQSQQDRSSDPSAVLVTVSEAHYGGSEAYRMLRTNLLFSRAGQRLHTLVVTSAVPDEGKSTTSGNLAVTFAQQGMRVLLMGCDLRRASVHSLFGVPREPGLSQVLVGLKDVEEVIHPTGVEGLYVIPAGTPPPNPAEILGSRAMREFVERLKGEFELIIFDTPPVLAAADAAVLAKYADGTLMVVRAGSTDRGVVQQALYQLQMVGARMLGAVLNDPDSVIQKYGTGYYYSYYYYGEPAGA